MASQPKMSEAQLNAEIRTMCAERRLHAFSATTYRIPGAKSKRPGSSQGFPDWVIVGAGGALFWECKSEDGRRSMAQVRWGKVIDAAGFTYALVRPSDLKSGMIARELDRVAQPG